MLTETLAERSWQLTCHRSLLDTLIKLPPLERRGALAKVEPPERQAPFARGAQHAAHYHGELTFHHGKPSLSDAPEAPVEHAEQLMCECDSH